MRSALNQLVLSTMTLVLVAAITTVVYSPNVFTASSLDTTPPTLSIASPANGTVTNLLTVAVSGTASDNVAVQSVKWKVDNGAIFTATGTTSWSLTTSSLSSGVHNIQVIATDTSGNVASKTLQVTAGTVKVTLKTNHQSFAVSLNGTQYSQPTTLLLPIKSNWQLSTTSPQLISGVKYYFVSWSDGAAITHLITIPANMVAKTYMATFSSTIDTTPPALSIVSPSNGMITNLDRVIVNGTASDNVKVLSVKWKVDNGAIFTATGTTSWSFITPTLSNGLHSIQVNATDPSGNVASKTIQVTTGTVLVTFNSNHMRSPLNMYVNGTSYWLPVTLPLGVGSNWLIGTPSPQSATSGIYVFTQWSDGGANPHVITIAGSAATKIYTASFKFVS